MTVAALPALVCHVTVLVIVAILFRLYAFSGASLPPDACNMRYALQFVKNFLSFFSVLLKTRCGTSKNSRHILSIFVFIALILDNLYRQNAAKYIGQHACLVVAHDYRRPPVMRLRICSQRGRCHSLIYCRHAHVSPSYCLPGVIASACEYICNAHARFLSRLTTLGVFAIFAMRKYSYATKFCSKIIIKITLCQIFKNRSD